MIFIGFLIGRISQIIYIFWTLKKVNFYSSKSFLTNKTQKNFIDLNYLFRKRNKKYNIKNYFIDNKTYLASCKTTQKNWTKIFQSKKNIQ